MMVVVTVEARYQRTPDGRVWTQTEPTRAFWERYLSVFDRVRVVARVDETHQVPAGATRIDGGPVEVWPVPYYLGPWQYASGWLAVRRAVRKSASAEDAVILRVPSPIGSLLAAARDRRRLPYALEMVGDPRDVCASGVVKHPLRPLIRATMVANLRRQCRRAVGVAYVTERFLQRRYPAGRGALTASYSSIQLRPEAFVAAPRADPGMSDEPVLISVGALDQMYKGIDTLVAAVAQLTADGLRLRLVHLGDGRYRRPLEELAERLGVADRVSFAGMVAPGAAVRAYLDAADLFVMPSRTEGLPRALIEAMARGLPAIASTVGGVPELMVADCLVRPDDPALLAAAIARLLADPARRIAASQRNLTRARDFAEESLAARRIGYHGAVRAATSAHLQARPDASPGVAGQSHNATGQLTTVQSWDAFWNRPDARSSTRGRGSFRHTGAWTGLLGDLLDSSRTTGPTHVLELGCAPGNMLLDLHRLRPTNVYSGIDNSSVGIEIASRHLREAGVDAELHLGDIRSTSLPLVDLVVSFGLVEHFEDPAEVMRNHRAFLKPGGVAAVTVPNYAHPLVVAILKRCAPETLATHKLDIMSPRSLHSAFAAAGFSDIRVGASGGPILPNSRVRPGTIGASYRLASRAWNVSAGWLPRVPWPAVIWGTGVHQDD